MTKYMRSLREWQRRYLIRAIKKANGSVSAASRATGINRTHFYNMCRRLKVHVDLVRPANEGNEEWKKLGRAEHGMGA